MNNNNSREEGVSTGKKSDEQGIRMETAVSSRIAHATRTSPAMSTTSTVSSTASSVINTFWTGASTVSNYMWSLWEGLGGVSANTGTNTEAISEGR